jgi:hypothetical protein
MRKLTYLVAGAALSGLALSVAPASAGPVASGLASGNLPAVSEDGLVQKVHRWHCRKRYGWFRGHKRWHRHWKACRDYDDYDYHDYDYDDYSYSYPYSYSYGGPFIALQFGDFDDDHHHKFRRKHRKHWNWHD